MLVAIEKYPRRKRRWPWVILAALIVLIAPIALLYVMVYDGNSKNVKIQDNFNMETFGNRVLVDSLDPAKDEAKMSFVMTENDMDNILINVLSQASTINRFVKKAYCTINGDKYDFFVDIDGVYIKSRLRISTTLKDDVENDRFVFQISDMAIGKFTGLRNIGKSLFGNFINEDVINSFLGQANFGMKYSSSESAFIFNKKDIFGNLNNGGSGTDSFFTSIMETMMDEGVFTYNTQTNDFIAGDVDLSKLHANELVTDKPGQITIQEGEIREKICQKMETLVTNDAVNPNDGNLPTIFKYLFNGWNRLTESEKDIVGSTDMSSIGLHNSTEQKAYVPVNIYDDSKNLTQKMEAKINVDTLLKKDTELAPGEDNKYLCSLSEGEIDEYIKSKDVVGYNSLAHRYVEGGYKVNFFAIDNFYANIYNDGKSTAEFVSRININGYPTALTFTSTVHDVIENNKMTFKVDDVKYGTMAAEKMKGELFGIIEGALQGGDNSIIADKENLTMSFNFDTVIATAKQKIKDGLDAKGIPYTETQINEAFEGNIDIATYGADRDDDDGGIKITLDRSVRQILGI